MGLAYRLVRFLSSVGTLRDPDGVIPQWRRVRDELGYEWVTGHTSRRTLATVIDAEGMTARTTAASNSGTDTSP